MSEPDIFTMEFQEADDCHPDRKSTSSSDSLSHMTPFKAITQALSPEGIGTSESMAELPTTSSEVLDPTTAVGLTRTASTGLPVAHSNHSSGGEEPNPANSLDLEAVIFPPSGAMSVAQSAPIDIPGKPTRKLGTASLSPPTAHSIMSAGSGGKQRKESATKMLKQFLLGPAVMTPPSRKGSAYSVSRISVTGAMSMYPSYVSELSIDSPSDDEEDYEAEADKHVSQRFLRPDNRKLSCQSNLDRMDRSNNQINGNGTAVADGTKLQRSISMPPQYEREAVPQRKLSGLKDLFRSKSRRTSKEETATVDDVIDNDLEVGELSVATGPAGKRPFKQTVLEDLPEGPEGETLTSQSATRMQLANAALALSRGEYGMKAELAKLEEQLEAEKVAEEKAECRRYVKNMFVLCLSFFFIFTAYLSLRNLQSSINAKGGLGMYAFSSLYAFFFIGCIFAPTIVQRLRPKRTMLMCQIGISLYDIANFYPTFYTMIPISGVVGFSLGVIWTAHATYITNIAANYARLTEQRLQDVLVKFNGMHFVFYQLAQIVGGLLSSLVLNGPPPSSEIVGNISVGSEILRYLHNNTVLNDVFYWDDGNLTSFMLPNECGMKYCPRKASSGSSGVEQYMVYILLGIFTACSVVGVLVLLFFLDRLEGVMKKPKAPLARQLKSVFRFYADRRVVLLVGLMFYSMLQASFLFGEFTKSFVTCSLGVHMVGFVMVCLSVSSGFASFINGRIQQYIGRIPLILTGIVSQAVMLVVMLIWDPDPSQEWMFFLIAFFWGIGDGIVVAQTISVIGTMFSDNKEPAFAALKMTQSAALFSFFVTAQYFCTSTKVILVSVSLIIGLIGYVGLEGMLFTQNKDKLKQSKPSEEVTLSSKDSKLASRV